MMKKIVLLMLILSIISCSVTKTQDVFGSYKKIGKDYSYILILNKDSTFFFSKIYFEGNSKCEGKWSNISHDTISLICNEEQYPAQITTGYMNKRNLKIVLLRNTKIKINEIILKKQ
jgi:hypothetical protein